MDYCHSTSLYSDDSTKLFKYCNQIQGDMMVANKIIYWKFKEPFKYLSYYSLYDINWLIETSDRLSWNAMYIMDEHDKITIGGYYCLG